MNKDEKFFSKIGTTYLIYAFCALLFQIIIINILYVANIDIANNFNHLTIMGAVCNYILPFPILLYLMNKFDCEKLEKHSLNLKIILKYICIAFTLMIFGNLIGMLVTNLLGVAMQNEISNPVQNLINNSDIMLNLILISIIGPIFEEIIFRKFLIDRTIKYGAAVSIILSATLFGFVHGNINQFFYAFLLGGFFAYVYIKTGEIIYPIILHISLNLLGSVASQFIVGSANAIAQGSYTGFDMSIIAIYMLFIILALFIGVYSMLTFKKEKFSEIKNQIPFKNPFKTIFINYGMILFIIFCISEMIYQIMLS